MNNQDLAKIVKQVQINKEKYFEKLFNESYRTIYYLSLKFLNNEVEAQDVAQEIILYIYNHIEELKLPEGFNNWMNRITYNTCKNRMKQLSRRKEDDYEEVKGEQLSEDNPENVAQTKEKNKFVLDIINELPMKQKEVVLLYYYQQLTTPEIAEVLSCSLSSVQNRLYKAKKSIQNKMQNSKTYTTQQLFSIGVTPVLYKILSNEANHIVMRKIKRQIRVEIVGNKNKIENGSRSKINKHKASEKKTNTVTLCLWSIAVVLLLATTALTLKSLDRIEKRGTSTVGTINKLQNKSEENQLQPMISDALTENTIPNLDGNENVETLIIEKITERSQETESNIQVQTEEEISTKQQVEAPVNSTEMESEISKQNWYLFDTSPNVQVNIWNGDIEKEFTNVAFIKDKDLEELKYAYDTLDNEENSSVYDEERYKKDSEIVYHKVASPLISLVKSSTLEQDEITYYIRIENIGEVTAYNVIIKDMIPQYTEFIKMIDCQSDAKVQMESRYQEEIETIFWTIDQLGLGETLTIGFQVKIKESEYQNDREIKNIAHMKVSGKDSDANDLLEEQNYIASNEIIHIMQQQENSIPKTGDNTSEIGMLLIVIQTTFFLIVFLLKRKMELKKSKN